MQKRDEVCKLIEIELKNVYEDCVVYYFGSNANSLCQEGSDIDIEVYIPSEMESNSVDLLSEIYQFVK